MADRGRVKELGLVYEVMDLVDPEFRTDYAKQIQERVAKGAVSLGDWGNYRLCCGAAYMFSDYEATIKDPKFKMRFLIISSVIRHMRWEADLLSDDDNDTKLFSELVQKNKDSLKSLGRPENREAAFEMIREYGLGLWIEDALSE